MSSKLKGRVALNKGVHHALDDFRWMLKDIKERPTRIPELVPLPPSAEGHHDASGLGAGGVWFPSEHLIAREGFENKPTVWRLKWPQYIIDRLVTSENPDGTISNSDLELAGGLLHLEALSQTFDIRERTVLSKQTTLTLCFGSERVVLQLKRFQLIFYACLEFINASIDMSPDMIILQDRQIPLPMHSLVTLNNHGKNYLHHSNPTCQNIQPPKLGIPVPKLCRL